MSSRLREEFNKAERDFPTTKKLFSPTEVIDHLMADVITSQRAKRRG